MPMYKAYVAALELAMEAEADPERAVAMKRYMRDQFEFLGLPAPKLSATVRTFLERHGLPSQEEAETVVRELWLLPEREYQYAALTLLTRLRGGAPRARIHLYAELITTKSWWDTVDALASNLVGHLLARYPDLIMPTVDAWTDSGSIWLQRTAILFQLKYKTKTDVPLLFELIMRCSGSQEFFLQKAIGWALREYSKTAPETVRDFVAKHPLAPLSKREALKVMLRAEQT